MQNNKIIISSNAYNDYRYNQFIDIRT